METQCFHWAIYRLSANYVLPTTYFTKSQLHVIRAQAHSAMVSRSGYCRMTANDIIYGPKQYEGAGFFHLYDDQGYGQVKTFMKLWRSPSSQAGKLLRVAVSWAQHGVGTSAEILQDVTTRWPHFKAKWLKSLRQYLRDFKNLHFNQLLAKVTKTNDIFLMDVALTSNKFKLASL